MAEGLPEVWAGEDRVYEVFETLIGNAMKFTKQGGISLGAKPGEVKSCSGWPTRAQVSSRPVLRGVQGVYTSADSKSSSVLGGVPATSTLPSGSRVAVKYWR